MITMPPSHVFRDFGPRGSITVRTVMLKELQTHEQKRAQWKYGDPFP